MGKPDRRSVERLRRIIGLYCRRAGLERLDQDSWLIGQFGESVGRKFCECVPRNPGVYWFAEDDEVKYVGRASVSVGLRKRVRDNIRAQQDGKWAKVVKNKKTVVGVVVFPKGKSHWAPSLEALLINALGKNEFNRRMP